MSGPRGFERFNTAASGSRWGRNVVYGLMGQSFTPAAIRYRLKLLAVIIVSVAIAAYAGPGLASGGSENMDANETVSVEQYDGEGRADRAPGSPTGQNGEPEEALSKTSPGFSPSVPFSYQSFTKDISVVGDEPATGVTRGRAGGHAAGADAASAADTEDFAEPSIPVVDVPLDKDADAGSQASSIPATPVSYNAETYCRTYERGAPARSSTKSRAVFPLPEEYFDSYDDTWGAARPQGGHEGTDMMSPAGTPEYAITDGTVVRVSGSNGNGWNYLGGYTVMIRADNGIGPVKKGDLFYYAHMERESVLPIGAKVEAGEQVGVVGDTGYGPEGARGQFPPHLHLGWYDMTGTTSEAPSGAMNPYPLLEWLKRNGGTASGGWGSGRASQGYCDYQERVVAEPPASDESDDHGHDLPPGVSSGSSADLDTGSSDPSPSPMVKRQVNRSQTESQAVTRTSPRIERETRRNLPRVEESFAEARQGRIPRPAPEPPPDSRGATESARSGDSDAGRSDRPARTVERKKQSEIPPSSSNPRPQEPETPAIPGSPPPDDTKSSRPIPDKPEPDKPEPDKPEPDKPEPDKPEPDKPERDSKESTPSRSESEAREPEEKKESPRRASILPTAFHDQDADGERDAEEKELSSWPASLRGPETASATGESGARIGGLEPGGYRVTVEAEEGYVRTTPATVRLRTGERREARPSFGFAELAEIHVVVCDAARGEPCLQKRENPRRWELDLRDEKGRTVAESTIGRAGGVRFPDLRPGVYDLIFAFRKGSSAGEMESKKLSVTGGGVWLVEIREEDSQESRGGKLRETYVEVSRHLETGERKR